VCCVLHVQSAVADSRKIHDRSLTSSPLHLTRRQEDFVDKDQQAQTKLTEEQKRKIKSVTQRDAEAVELGVEELEERIAPMKLY
jgi:hypothetical protein